jgi:hypothetical protein
LPFAGEKKGFEPDPFSNVAQDTTKNLKTTEFPEICGRVLSLTFLAGMSQTPFGPSLKLVGEAYMRNLSGFANLRSIIVLWIFLRTGMPFFFF